MEQDLLRITPDGGEAFFYIFFGPFMALLIEQLRIWQETGRERGGVTRCKGTQARSWTRVRCRASAHIFVNPPSPPKNTASTFLLKWNVMWPQVLFQVHQIFFLFKSSLAHYQMMSLPITVGQMVPTKKDIWKKKKKKNFFSTIIHKNKTCRFSGHILIPQIFYVRGFGVGCFRALPRQ